MAEREIETHRQGSPAFVAVSQEFSCGVVDGRNVVDVEGMAHTEGVGGDTQPDAECARASELEMFGHGQKE